MLSLLDSVDLWQPEPGQPIEVSLWVAGNAVEDTLPPTRETVERLRDLAGMLRDAADALSGSGFVRLPGLKRSGMATPAGVSGTDGRCYGGHGIMGYPRTLRPDCAGRLRADRQLYSRRRPKASPS